MTKNYNAFTLIELLVVIAIIGILAGLVTLSFTSSQKQARDTQRKSDISQYRNSIEAFANKSNGLYPPPYTTTSDLSSTICTAMGLSGCPEDPSYVSGGPYPAYKYQSSAGGVNYVLWAQLENGDNNWVVCSNGKSGIKANGFTVTGGVCPI